MGNKAIMLLITFAVAYALLGTGVSSAANLTSCGSYAVTTNGLNALATGSCSWGGGTLEISAAGGDSGAVTYTISKADWGIVALNSTNARCLTYIQTVNAPAGIYNITLRTGAGGGSCGSESVQLQAAAMPAIVYNGIYNGTFLYLMLVPNQKIEDLPGNMLTLNLTDFQTNNASYSCLNGENIRAWTSPEYYPGQYIFHNGLQNTQCAYITLVFPMPITTTSTTTTSTTTTSSTTSTTTSSTTSTTSTTSSTSTSTSTSTTTIPPVAQPTIAPVNAVIDQGQLITLTASWQGGPSTYSVSWSAGAATSCAGGTPISNTLVYTNSSTILFRGSGSPSTVFLCVAVNGSYSNPDRLTVNPALSGAALASQPSLPSTQQVGNVITLTANVAGGTSPYAYNFIVTNAATNSIVLTKSFNSVGSTQQQWAWTITSAYANDILKFGANVVDSAYSPESISSPTIGTLTVSPNTMPAVTPTISVSLANSTINIGHAAQVNENITNANGIGPFSIQLSQSNTVRAIGTIPSGGGVSTLSYIPNDIGALQLVATTSYNYPVYNSVITTNLPGLTVEPIITPPINSVFVQIAANVPITLYYPSGGSSFTFVSSKNETAHFAITNVTALYANIPAPGANPITVVLLNASIVGSGNTINNMSVTTTYPCSLQSPAPYLLSGGSWTAISSTANSASCSVTFNMPIDPVFGVFASPATTTTTTISNGGGGGGGGVGGAPGSPGPRGPTITQISDGYQVSNLTQLNTFTVFSCVQLNAVENFITPTSAGITLNSTSYTLQLNQAVQTGANATATCYVELTNVAYLPIGQTIVLQFYHVAKPVVQQQPANATINVTLKAGAITPALPTVMAGNTITLRANASGGVAPYTYEWYSGSSSYCASDSPIAGQNSVSYLATPTNSITYYCYKVTDFAGANAVSATNLVAASQPVPTPSAGYPLPARAIAVAVGVALIAGTLIYLILFEGMWRKGEPWNLPKIDW